MSETQAIALANRFMVENQFECFRVAKKKEAIVRLQPAPVSS
jgi:hypothetical protein